MKTQSEMAVENDTEQYTDCQEAGRYRNRKRQGTCKTCHRMENLPTHMLHFYSD